MRPAAANGGRRLSATPTLAPSSSRPVGGGMTREDLRARVRRLDELTRGVMKEVVLIQECEDPLLRNERLAYLDGLRDAVSGMGAARVTLARALQRLDGVAGREGA